MKDFNNIDDLKAEFDKFVRDFRTKWVGLKR